MPYLTPPELAVYIRDWETTDQSNESEEMVANLPFMIAAIASASADLDSLLGVRYALPLPSSDHVKRLCYPIAHWEMEKQGLGKRDYVQAEYERAMELVKAIAAGTAALVGVDGKPVVPIGGDASAEAGIQKVGVFVGQRTVEWSL